MTPARSGKSSGKKSDRITSHRGTRETPNKPPSLQTARKAQRRADSSMTSQRLPLGSCERRAPGAAVCTSRALSVV
ncbi:hypothetical protein VZT92_009702 [Zoarces viviparus]|uniref:Uncharacterized protein n=1 Tax=Zoarces viviparus TaxID=48416 RepID=A0AAW1FC61_ZOAVI